MKIKSITLNDFKRFKDLRISDLPESAKLVVLVGPNGCGKSSVFDAIYKRALTNSQGIDRSFSKELSAGSYYDNDPARSSIEIAVNGAQVSYHGGNPSYKATYRTVVYVRTAYRNDPSPAIDKFKKVGTSLDEVRIKKLIDNDQTVGLNYQRLISQALNDLFDDVDGNKTLIEFREEILNEIQSAMKEIFPDLTLKSLGNPLVDQTTFYFDKGNVKNFTYENLSGGEKAAFDLILDLIVKRREYGDTVFCIDEPEAHIDMKVQQKLLTVLYNLIPDNCQLWIATHSIGMMRGARDIQEISSDKVVFLDFANRDFDTPQEIKPVKTNFALWESMHAVTIDDLVSLTFSETLCLCESAPKKSFDSDCYNEIFSLEKPEVKFISVGAKNDVQYLALAMSRAMPKMNIFPLRDRDNMTIQEVQEMRSTGMRVLSRTCIESYLLDDEVLNKFITKHKLENMEDDVLVKLKKIRDEDTKDIKSAAQNIRTHLVNLDKRLKIGDDRENFMKHSLAPLFCPSMKVYQELKRDIFGDGDE